MKMLTFDYLPLGNAGIASLALIQNNSNFHKELLLSYFWQDLSVQAESGAKILYNAQTMFSLLIY